MQIEDFFSCSIDLIKYFPLREVKCNYPHTFAVVEEIDHLNTQNFEKSPCDKNKPYFYSRAWETKGGSMNNLTLTWPAIVLFEENFSVREAFTNREETSFFFKVYCVDSYQGSKDCNGCSGRVGNEYYRDTLKILQEYLKLLEACVVVSVDGKLIYSHPDIINMRRLSGEYVTVTPLIKESISIQNHIRQDNSSLNGFRVYKVGVPNLVGTVIDLRVRIPTCLIAEPKVDIIRENEIKLCC